MKQQFKNPLRRYTFVKPVNAPDLHITRASVAELKRLQQIGRQTFSETFSSANTEADMAKYLTEKFSEDQLTKELCDGNSEFYLAILKDEVVGYLKVNFSASQTEMKDENAMEIERIYVLKEYHGKEVGQQLYQKALEIARKRRLSFIWLGVWEENPRAIRFYEKNGFTIFDKHIFRLGNDEQTDLLMKLKIF